MSTRCVINFTYGPSTAKVYRGSDGYPDGKHGMIAELARFFKAVEKATRDRRFNDPSYLAAKFIVWQAHRRAVTWDIMANKYRRNHRLDFIGVGVVDEDPGDIEYVYFVDCQNHDQAGRPVVTHRTPER
jgi:hypothetical protein